MKILLTGLPGTGKTTLLQIIARQLNEPVTVIAAEVRDISGARTGFTAQSSLNISGEIASKENLTSSTRIGDYGVDIEAIDRVYVGTIEQALQQPDQWLILDEIGRMQMLSPRFAQAARQLVNSDNNFIATIRHGDDWTAEFTDRPDVQVLTLTPDNREQVKAEIISLITATS